MIVKSTPNAGKGVKISKEGEQIAFSGHKAKYLLSIDRYESRLLNEEVRVSCFMDRFKALVGLTSNMLQSAHLKT